MLKMGSHCECCGTDLAPDREGAMICSFECTFCVDCGCGRLAGWCPNCGGELVRRPTRAAKYLERYPPSSERKQRSATCLENPRSLE